MDVLLEQVYREGGSPDWSRTMSYSDAYMNRQTTTNYLEHSLGKSLDRLEESLLPVLNEFDVIVVSGFSGVIPGAILAHKWQKQLVIVRKDQDTTHGVRLEGGEYFAEGTPYVVIDDFIATGTTMQRIFEKLADRGYSLPKYVCLYSGKWSDFTVVDGWIVAKHVEHGLYVPTKYTEKEEK